MDCPSQHDLILDEWGERLMKPLGGKRFPIGGMIELNERCNLSCVHCFINKPVGDPGEKQFELSTNQVKAILDKITNAGCLFLTLTGGEPLVRSDFIEIYHYARRKGMLVTLFTNATMITPKIADALASSPPQLVEISLYGGTKDTYEKITQLEGAFDRCMLGIRLLLDRGIKVGLKAVVISVNKHELSDMMAFAEELGVNFRYDGTIWPRIDGDQCSFRCRLSVEEMLALDRDNPQRLEEWCKMADAFKGEIVRNEYVFNCGAGLNTFHIDSRGHLSACIMVRDPFYDLTEMDFMTAWEKIGEIRHWKRYQYTICENCTVGALCSQCPGWSLIVHGDYETPVDYICQLGKRRAAQIEEIKIYS